jgi:hypothetical protein
MSSLIKCPKCKQWSEDSDYCLFCNELLNATMQREREIEVEREAYRNRPKDAFDLYLERIKTSDKVLDKFAYFFLQSAWWTFVLVATGGLAFAALGPG